MWTIRVFNIILMCFRVFPINILFFSKCYIVSRQNSMLSLILNNKTNCNKNFFHIDNSTPKIIFDLTHPKKTLYLYYLFIINIASFPNNVNGMIDLFSFIIFINWLFSLLIVCLKMNNKTVMLYRTIRNIISSTIWLKFSNLRFFLHGWDSR